MTTETLAREAPAETHTVSAPPAPVAETGEDPFVLDVHVISDVRPDLLPTACSTDDGCKPSCASSCAST
ncbi:FxLD family lanthipeptide [Streptomyces daliensis]|uniref:FxLD family lanthipeptide n=1 Tax=Streptomyces daliensis TaxID=299421 RepID=A0A8T4IQN9_9ACTN|nr:FxLD family lanthipeptide [Streptomyces daliensis]